MKVTISGHDVLVDSVDAPLLEKHHFYVASSGYVVTNGYGTHDSLHRMIMCTPPGKHTDHINGNKLDNRRCNLRICSASENCANTGMRRNNKSGYKGVWWDKDRGRWRAGICVARKSIYLGLYDTKEAASAAYKEAAIHYFGQYAKR